MKQVSSSFVDFRKYELDPAFYDELLTPSAVPRPHTQLLYDTLSRMSIDQMDSIQDRVSRSFMREGISFTLYGEEEVTERIIPIDCIPRIMPLDEWQFLERGLKQRVNALNRFLNDVYHDARIVKDGVVPIELVKDCPQYRIEMEGVDVALDTAVGICGTDIIRTNHGYCVLEDNLRVPSGVSYMIANRKAVKSNLPRTYRSSHVLDVENYGVYLYRTLCEYAPSGNPDPCIALLTPGVYNAAFYEHMFLADEIGADLVEGRDLIVNNDFVYMRTTSGLRRVDVIYRRVDDDFLDPIVFREDSVLGIPGLMHAYKRGNVALVNAPGTGVADDKSVYFHVPDMVRYYLCEDPILKNVETHLCRYERDLEYTLDNLDRLVVKTVGGSGGYGMLIGTQASAKERNEYAKHLKASPANYISQPVLPLSRSPCWIDGRPQPRCVDLRPFVLTGSETRIVGGAFCRVALPEGSLVVNSSQGGGGKDVWVVSG